jgi:hypothetical protein
VPPSAVHPSLFVLPVRVVWGPNDLGRVNDEARRTCCLEMLVQQFGCRTDDMLALLIPAREVTLWSNIDTANGSGVNSSAIVCNVARGMREA